MDLLSTRIGRRVLFSALYMSEGAPIGFLWWTLPAKLRAAGMDLGAITQLTALLVLPWVFKFLWSPAVDIFRSRRWGLRSWILAMQFIMGVSLIPLAVWDLSTSLHVILPFLILHAFAAATQDAAIDALAITSVPDRERGATNGWMQMGMLTGRSALGGGALLLEEIVGNTIVVAMLIIVIWSSSILLLFSKDAHPAPLGGTMQGARRFLAHLQTVASRRVTWLGLLFAATAGAGFEAVGSVAGAYLIDMGLGKADVGSFFALNAVVGMALGAIAGGHLTDRWGTRRTVPASLLLTFACIIVIAATGASLTPWRVGMAMTSLTALYFCIGLFTASSYALFMQITDVSLGATQFSAYMGATNACESWATYAVGRVAPTVGYASAFGLMGILSLSALPVLRGIANQTDGPSSPTQNGSIRH